MKALLKTTLPLILFFASACAVGPLASNNRLDNDFGDEDSELIAYELEGAFSTPGTYNSEKGITLLQAIAAANGFLEDADESKIRVIREGSKDAIMFTLDYNQVLRGKEPNPVLKDGDLIEVDLQ